MRKHQVWSSLVALIAAGVFIEFGVYLVAILLLLHWACFALVSAASPPIEEVPRGFKR